MLGSTIKMQKLTILDIVKGLLFCAVGLAICFLVTGLFGSIFFGNILKIKNPLFLVLGATGFLVFYCFIIALSKVKQAGYQKNILSEVFKQIRGK